MCISITGDGSVLLRKVQNMHERQALCSSPAGAVIFAAWLTGEAVT